MSIISDIESQKALTIFKKRQEYNKGYYAQKKKERTVEPQRGRKPMTVDELDVEKASHILTQYRSKNRRKKQLNDVDSIKTEIEKLQKKLIHLQFQQTTTEESSDDEGV